MNTESQTDRITQLEAACVAMREALLSWKKYFQSDIPKNADQQEQQGEEFTEAWFQADKALSTDAGKSLLEKYQYHLADNQRLKGELERVCDRLQAVEAERDRLRKACVGMVAWWNTPERDQPEKLPIRIRDCEQAISADAGKSLLDRLRKSESDREELKESLALELAENIKLFDLLGLRTPGDFEHNTSTEAVTIKVKELLDRLQAAESRLAEWETLRTNDAATHQNILRGIIALTRPQALHLAGAQDYDELKDRLQAVEKSHTALRLASEELITSVRHGDQEDIGEAMGKIESILQPTQKDAPQKGTK